MMPYVTHNIGLPTWVPAENARRRREEYVETLARQHAEHTGLSLPVARRIVTALSIAANKPEPDGPDYARFEDALTRERTPTLNTPVKKFTAEEEAQMRALAAEGLQAAAIAKRLHRARSTVARRARSLGIEIARVKRRRRY